MAAGPTLDYYAGVFVRSASSAGNRRTTTPLPTKFPDFALCMADGADGRAGRRKELLWDAGRKEADLSSRNAVFHNSFGCRGKGEGRREGYSQRGGGA